MDPTETLRHLASAISVCDYATAVELLNSYYQWRLKGGAEPAQGDSRADTLANHLADKLEEPS